MRVVHMQISTIGIDIDDFQVHGADAAGTLVLKKQLRETALRRVG